MQRNMQTHPSEKKCLGGQTTLTTLSIFLFLLPLVYFSEILTLATTTATVASARECEKQETTTFDIIVQEGYEMAFSTQAAPQRKKLDLTTWTRGTGGLTDNDRILLAEIYGNASSVFEYGLGESTLIASHVGVPRYAGIDSDALWVSMSRDAVHPHFRFYLADIGITGLWGMPNNTKLTKSILDYQLAPLIVEPYAFDVYMVDGRMRFGCMMASFLHASSRGAPTSQTLVLNHDCKETVESHKRVYRGNRLVYKAADHLLDLVHHSGGKLCAYRRKQNTTDVELLTLWREHSNVWDR
jgi:hypothetical protein